MWDTGKLVITHTFSLADAIFGRVATKKARISRKNVGNGKFGCVPQFAEDSGVD
jgi:hypothetical protein